MLGVTDKNGSEWSEMAITTDKHNLFFKQFYYEVEVIPDNWTQKFEPPGGQISKP